MDYKLIRTILLISTLVIQDSYQFFDNFPTMAPFTMIGIDPITFPEMQFPTMLPMFGMGFTTISPMDTSLLMELKPKVPIKLDEKQPMSVKKTVSHMEIKPKVAMRIKEKKPMSFVQKKAILFNSKGSLNLQPKVSKFNNISHSTLSNVTSIVTSDGNTGKKFESEPNNRNDQVVNQQQNNDQEGDLVISDGEDENNQKSTEQSINNQQDQLNSLMLPSLATQSQSLGQYIFK